MGTRGLLGFIISGKKYGVYMQYDSYLEGVGVDIAKFLMLLTDDEDKLMAKRLREVGDLGLASVVFFMILLVSRLVPSYPDYPRLTTI